MTLPQPGDQHDPGQQANHLIVVPAGVAARLAEFTGFSGSDDVDHHQRQHHPVQNGEVTLAGLSHEEIADLVVRSDDNITDGRRASRDALGEDPDLARWADESPAMAG